MDKEVIVKPDILDQGIQRFAISGLSKQRMEEAVNEEILVDKSTGEFLLKNRDGVVISTDYLNRFKSSFDNAVIMAEQSGICGNIYHLEVDDIITPAVVPYKLNLLNEKLTLPDNNTKFLLNIDSTEYKVEEGVAKPIDIESDVVVKFKRGDMEISLRKKISDMNKLVVNTTRYSEVVAPVEILEIVIEPLPEYFGDENVKCLLHNMFITLNK